ncbi:MAG: ABC-2 family transporter protein [Candidatus Levybacteria bacterium]|nr:ABC-2 family transporter protein [Candidatus Levybacteria bacterium]
MKKYISLWLTMTSRITQIAFASRFGVVFFTLGKVIRFLFFLIFLVLIVSKTKSLAGYTLWQVILFFVTFNIIDIVTQFFLREVYRFRSYIVSGSFDYMLTKPLSPLFRSLFGGSDILDLITLVPLLGFLFYVLNQIGGITIAGVVLYVLLLINAFVIALAFHIFVLGLGVIITEVDNAIWIYREMTALGRVPIAVYREPISWILTFILPVAAMITFPVQAVLGILSWTGVLLAFVFSGIFLLASLRFWRYALRQYSSASS